MKLLSNLASVLGLAPQIYRHPARPLLSAISVLCALGAAAAATASPGAMVESLAQMVGIGIALAGAKRMTAANSCITGRVLARTIFAACVAWLPIAISIALDVPAVAREGLMCALLLVIWPQAVLDPRCQTRFTPEYAAFLRQARAEMAHKLTVMGPPMGIYQGKEIASYLVDVLGQTYDFAGLAPSAPGGGLRPGQAVISPGLLYELRPPVP